VYPHLHRGYRDRIFAKTDAHTGACHTRDIVPVDEGWSTDSDRLPPDDGTRAAPKNGVATEPKVRVATDGKNPSRTYRYLLESPHDMKLLEHLATGQLALIDVNDGKVTKVGFPSLLRSVSISPGGQHFRVATMKKPFSYYVPALRFGSQEGLWSLEGKSLYTLATGSFKKPNRSRRRLRQPQTDRPRDLARRRGRPSAGADKP